MKSIASLTVAELASLITKTLVAEGINAVLVGGACVSIYSRNAYESYDLDFVSYHSHKQLTSALENLGFTQRGKYYVHSDTPYFIDFVAPPVAIGRQPIDSFAEMKTPYGTLQLLTATDCVKDRLASYFYWRDTDALEQARLVSKAQKIDLEALREWAKTEGKLDAFLAVIDSLG